MLHIPLPMIRYLRAQEEGGTPFFLFSLATFAKRWRWIDIYKQIQISSEATP